ncbi:MAG: hypothetical protein Fur0028_07570 [Bacteroidales bacterium]
MKKKILTFSKVALVLLLTINIQLFNLKVFAQAPQSFSYQAVVRNAQGNILPNQNVAFRFSIIENSTTGSVVYQETQLATTNALGLVVVAIGSGNVQQGTFSAIQWGSAPHFLKVELDIAGGSNFVDMGTTQLLSVPYALLSQKSISDTLWIQNGNNIYNSNVGRVGIGLTAPTGKVTIQGDTSNVLFEVRDKNGIPVFVVYQDSVHVYVSNTSAKTNKGTFAVNGKTQSKAGAHTIFRVVPDSIVEIKDANGLPIFKAFQDSVQVFVDNSGVKTNKGTFAVNGKTQSKAGERNYLRISPDSSRVYTEDPTAGFGVRDLSTGTATSYMNLTPENYFIGHNAGKNNQIGLYNIYLGYESGKNSLASSYCTFLGYNTGLNNESSDNTFIGFTAGQNHAIGGGNVFLGSKAGSLDSAGVRNIFIGEFAGNSNKEGKDNVFIGTQAGSNNKDGYSNIFIGTYTGMNNLGSLSGYNGNFNVFLGNWAGKFNTTGFCNIFIGDNSGSNNKSGYQNIYIGRASDGDSTSTDNTYVGSYTDMKGSGNTLLGSMAGVGGNGNFNVLLGNRAGWGIHQSNKLFIENTLDTLKPLINGDFAANRVAINRLATTYPLQVGTDNTNGNAAYLTAGGTWTNTSSKTLKDRFEELNKADLLSKIEQLDVKAWYYKGTQERHIGPFAEDFYHTFGTGVLDEPQYLGKSLAASDVAGVSLAAVKELIKINHEQENKINQLENEINELKKMLKNERVK